MRKNLGVLCSLFVLMVFLPVAQAAKPEGKGKLDKAPTEKVEKAKDKAKGGQHSKDDKSDDDSASDDKSTGEDDKSKSKDKSNKSDKSDAERKEEGKGSEKGQEMREEHSRKWWKFWGE